MEYHDPPLYVTLISAKGIKDVSIFSKMHVYAVAWLEGDPKSKRTTFVDKGCGTNPKWNYNRMKFAFHDHLRSYSLVVQLMAVKSFLRRSDKKIGSVTIPIRDLFVTGLSRERIVQYPIRMQSGKTKGWLNFSYEFGTERPQTKAHANDQRLPEYVNNKHMYKPVETGYPAMYGLYRIPYGHAVCPPGKINTQLNHHLPSTSSVDDEELCGKASKGFTCFFSCKIILC